MQQRIRTTASSCCRPRRSAADAAGPAAKSSFRAACARCFVASCSTRRSYVGLLSTGCVGAAAVLFALALCQRLGELLGTTVDADELEQAVESYSEQVTEAVSADPDTQAYVEQLEQRVDELGPAFDIPSGDTIAAELTRFLREREQDGGGPESPSAQ